MLLARFFCDLLESVGVSAVCNDELMHGRLFEIKEDLNIKGSEH